MSIHSATNPGNFAAKSGLTFSKFVFEILNEVEKAQSFQDKVQILRENNSDGLSIVLKGTYDPDIEWLVPKSVQYTPNITPPTTNPTHIHTEAKKLYLFANTGVSFQKVAPSFTLQDRAKKYIALLEYVPKEDAAILIAMVNKDLTSLYPSITPDLVAAAFPALLGRRGWLQAAVDSLVRQGKLMPHHQWLNWRPETLPTDRAVLQGFTPFDRLES